MDFSDTYSFTGPPPAYSPDGRYVACVQEQRIIIRDVDTLQMSRIVSCLDKVRKIDWAPNSKFVLCSLNNRAQVFSLDDPEWSCKVGEGAAGARHCLWAPDCKSVLVVADFQIRITAYNLLDGALTVLRGPKFPDKALAFSPDGQTLAYAERTDSKEFVCLVGTGGWELRMRIATTTQDVADLAWSPNGSCFVLWDTPLTYKLLVYSCKGHCLASYSAYQDALGIRSVQWSPGGQMLAVGSYDQEVRVLSCHNWRPVASLQHGPVIQEGSIVAYNERDEVGEHPELPGTSRCRYVVMDLPFKLNAIKHPVEKPNPRIGISQVLWSADGRYFSSRNECMPNVVFIWSSHTLTMSSILIQAAPVRSCHWDATRTKLVVSTGGSKLYLWTPEGASCVHVPIPGFKVNSAQLASDGNSLVLADKDNFCCAYLTKLPLFG